MTLRKGMKLHFTKSGRTEVITKGSSNSVMGMITTDKQEYSCDFIHRWLQFGFVELFDKKGNKIEISPIEYLP